MDTIDQFKSLVSAKGGVARANVFRVRLPSLPGVASSRDISLLCKDVQLPGRQILTNERRIGLQFEKVAYGYAIQDINMTFHVMNDYGIKRYFETWQDLAVNQTSLEVGYYNDYVRDIEISILKKGVGLPLFKKEFDLPLPTFIKNRLPTIGPINFRQGEIDLDLVTNDKVAYKVRILEAYPAAVVGVTMSDDNMDGLIDINVSFSYKDWVTQSTDQPSGFLDSLFDIFDKFKIG